MVDLGKKNKKRNGDFGCGLLWVFDDVVGFEKMGALGFMNLYLSLFFWVFGVCFLRKYRFMDLLEIGLFIEFMGLICWRIRCCMAV